MDLFYRPDRLRKVGFYLTELLTQLESRQFTIKASDLKDQRIRYNYGSATKGD